MTKKSAPNAEGNPARASLASTAVPLASWSEQRASNSRALSASTGGRAPQKTRSAIKKAYVRFDDYLDLNEENMRRSCKKIMNKLYCEPGSAPAVKANSQTGATPITTAAAAATPTADASLSAGSNVCRLPKSPPPLRQQQQPIGAPKPAVDQPVGGGGGSVCSKGRVATTISADKFADLVSQSVVASPNVAKGVCAESTHSTAVKSYLRLQYERRQKRQLELLAKMQRAQQQQHQQQQQQDDLQMVMNFDLGNGGLAKFNQDDNGQTRSSGDGAAAAAVAFAKESGDACHMQQLQHQQDLVAKSHELSKQRFFEKLERRESMKRNLVISSTQVGNSTHASRGTIFERQVAFLLPQMQPQSGSSAAAMDAVSRGVNTGVKLSNESKEQISRESVGRPIVANVDFSITTTRDAYDNSMLKTCQSSASPSSSTKMASMILNSSNDTASLHHHHHLHDDAHGQLAGPPTKLAPPPALLSESNSRLQSEAAAAAANLPPVCPQDPVTNELIVVHTHLPLNVQQHQTGLADGSASEPASDSVENNRRHRRWDESIERSAGALIKFSQGVHPESGNQFQLDKSAFEIKVPPRSSQQRDAGPGQHFDGFRVDDGFLVVKQVEAAAHQSVNTTATSDDEDDKGAIREMQENYSRFVAPSRRVADNEEAATAQQLESNKILLIGGGATRAATSSSSTLAADKGMARATNGASQQEQQHKRNAAATGPSTGSAGNNDATCQLQGTIKVQSSDNQYQLPREKVISAAISIGRVDREAGELPNHAADDEMKKVGPATTTSKSAADNNNGRCLKAAAAATASVDKRAAVKSKRQLELAGENKVAGRLKSENHERPEIKATQSGGGAGAGIKNNDHARQRAFDHLFNEPIALRESELDEPSDAQAKQQRQQVDFEEGPLGTTAAAPAVLAITGKGCLNLVRRGGGRVAEEGSGGTLVLEAAAAAAAAVDAAAAAAADAEAEAADAASLETIITNKPGARDVLPEANSKMLNRQIGWDVSASAASAAAPSSSPVPPLDNSMGNDAAKKVASQVDAADLGHDFGSKARQTAPGAFKHKEIENDDQCGGGDLEMQKRAHFSAERPLVGHSHHCAAEQAPLGDERQQYANPSSNRAAPACDQYGGHTGGAHSKSLPVSQCENVHPLPLPQELLCDRRSGDRLIEPLHCTASKSPSRTMQTTPAAGQQDCNCYPSPSPGRAIEEDIRSSCSSSGFGASVSATSSSSSTESHSSSSSSSSSSPFHHHRDHHRDHHHHSFRESAAKTIATSSAARRPAAGSMLAQAGGVQVYDVVRGGRSMPPPPARDSISEDPSRKEGGCSDTTSAYKQLLVGPDQAYPGSACKRGRPLLVENHGYASLVGRCQLEINGGAFQLPDFYPSANVGQYANLPNGKMAPPAQQSSPIVEYATVRAPSQRQTNGSGIGGGSGHDVNDKRIPAPPPPPAENKRHSTSPSNYHDGDEQRTSSETNCDSSLSGRRNSLSSANSGGFSKLPPVRLIDHNFANAVRSLDGPQEAALTAVGMESQQEREQPAGKKPSSLLKRFGSLVSRAFTTSTSNGAAGDQMAASASDFGGHPIVNSEKITLASPEPRANLGSSLGYQTGHSLEEAQSVELNNELVQMKLAEADLVILPTKHSNQKSQTNLPAQLQPQQQLAIVRKSSEGQQKEAAVAAAAAAEHGQHDERAASNSLHNHKSHRGAARQAGPPHASSRHRCGTKRHQRATTTDRLSRSISSISSSSSSSGGSDDDGTCSESSLEYLSLISPAPAHAKRDRSHAHKKRQLGREAANLRRASSLSDELESLMSPSEFESLRRLEKAGRAPATRKQRPGEKVSVKSGNKAAKSRISIDCVSPAGFNGLHLDSGGDKKHRRRHHHHHHQQQQQQQGKTSDGDITIEKSRSLLRWFGGGGNGSNSTHSLASSSLAAAPRANKFANYSSGARCESNRAIKPAPAHDQVDGAPALERKQGRHHALTGFLSLIEGSHASSEHKLDRLNAANEMQKYGGAKEPTSLIYAKVRRNRSAQTVAPAAIGGGGGVGDSKAAIRRRSSRPADLEARQHEFEPNGDAAAKCQSLNIYQSLMRNYVRKPHHRSHRDRGHHQHQQHHHHHHHNHGHATAANYHHKARQTCCSAVRLAHPSTRCGGTQCAAAGRPCANNSDCSSCDGGKQSSDAGSKSCGDKSGVWGQLIKISKSDGSQVVELQRAPSKSWGFFVARGAISNVKGIFISRMHDEVTSSSLAGLLSIGDRILSIDSCPIGPDFDILRVNQMISKKSKIVLRVRPFKG